MKTTNGPKKGTRVQGVLDKLNTAVAGLRAIQDLKFTASEKSLVDDTYNRGYQKALDDVGDLLATTKGR